MSLSFALLVLLLLFPQWCKGLHDGIATVVKSVCGKHTKLVLNVSKIAIFGYVAFSILKS